MSPGCATADARPIVEDLRAALEEWKRKWEPKFPSVVEEIAAELEGE